MSAPLDCPPLTVPGWLDETGEPTSCVSNHPCPGFDAETCTVDDNGPELHPEPLPLETSAPVPTQPLPDELAETGAALDSGLVLVLALAVAAMAAGVRLTLGRRA